MALTSIVDFAYLFKKGLSTTTPIQLCGRILRGKTPQDFETLTDEPENRKIVMLMAGDGLATLLGKSHYECLITIGYKKDYIKYKIDQGNQFKLVVFHERAFKQATWENVIKVIGKVYGVYIERKLNKVLKKLKQWSFKNIQTLGRSMEEIDRNGPDDKDYMTVERFAKCTGTLYQARCFLYHTIHLRELFSGDGYTYDEQGNKGLQEYIAPNKRLREFGEFELIPMDIQVP